MFFSKASLRVSKGFQRVPKSFLEFIRVPKVFPNKSSFGEQITKKFSKSSQTVPKSSQSVSKSFQSGPKLLQKCPLSVYIVVYVESANFLIINFKITPFGAKALVVLFPYYQRTKAKNRYDRSHLKHLNELVIDVRCRCLLLVCLGVLGVRERLR